MIEGAVVVARDIAAPIGHEWRRRLEAAVADRSPDVSNMQQEMARARRGHEREPAAVGRPARLHVHRPIARQRADVARGKIEQHQFERAAVVAHEDDGAAVGRTVRLIVAAAVGQLLGGRAVEPLAPQAALPSSRRAWCRLPTTTPTRVRW